MFQGELSFPQAVRFGEPVPDFAKAFGGRVFLICILVCSLLAFSFYVLDGPNMFWSFPKHVSDASHEDFIAFYRAGELVSEGHASEVYQPDRFHAGLAPGNGNLLMLNPPHFLLFAGCLPAFAYGTAKAIFIGFVAAGFVCLAWLGRQKPFMYLMVLTSAAAYYGFITLNISIFIACLIAFALLQADRRPVLAGLALALATVKPQYGLLVPVCLLAMGCWRTLISAAVGTLLLCLASALIYGVDVWWAYLTILNHPTYEAYFGSNMVASLTVWHAVGKLGGGASLQLAVQAAVLVAGVAMTWVGARRWNRDMYVALVLMASAFVSPSLFFYDWAFYVVGLCIMLSHRQDWPLPVQALAGLMWSQPVLGIVIYNFSKTAAFDFSVGVPLMCFGAICLFVNMAESERMEVRRAVEDWGRGALLT